MSHQFKMQHPTQTAILTALVLLCLVLLADCGPSQSAEQSDAKQADAKITADTQPPSGKRYNLTGRVVSIDKPAQSISVDGDEIPGFMAAMTMPYQLKDAGILDKLSPGDHIKAEIVAGSDGAYLENVVLTQKAASPVK